MSQQGSCAAQIYLHLLCPRLTSCVRGPARGLRLGLAPAGGRPWTPCPFLPGQLGVAAFLLRKPPLPLVFQSSGNFTGSGNSSLYLSLQA